LITISTRVSLKKYHTFNLTLGLGDDFSEWSYERIGTENEKMGVERELQELREKLAQVEEWKSRREEIEQELAKVWVDGDVLPPPSSAAATEVAESTTDEVVSLDTSVTHVEEIM
jgi:ATP-binding cassette subfamily D (ALD) long-chain fatty acid import protein